MSKERVFTIAIRCAVILFTFSASGSVKGQGQRRICFSTLTGDFTNAVNDILVANFKKLHPDVEVIVGSIPGDKLETTLAAQALAERITHEGGEAPGIGFDPRVADEAQAVIAAAAKHCGRVDILVNCVGLNREEKALEDAEANFDLVLGAM
jgi:hypothetical protein